MLENVLKKIKKSKNGLLLLAINILNKALGIVKVFMIGNVLGINAITDMYFFIMSMTIFISEAVLGTFSKVIVTVLGYEEDQGKKSNFISTMLTFFCIISFVIIALCYLMPNVFEKLFLMGIKATNSDLPRKLIKIAILNLVFISFIKVFRGYFNYKKNYLLMELYPLIQNIFFIFYFVIFRDKVNLIGLVTIGLISGALTAGIQFFNLKSKISLESKIYFDENFKKALMMSYPIFLGSAIGKINGILDKIIATFLNSGDLSILQYTNKIRMGIINIAAVTIATIVYPIAVQKAKESKVELSKYINNKNYMILILNVSLVAIIFILAPYILKVLFIYQKNSVKLPVMVETLRYYSFSIIFYSFITIYNKYFYSLQDTKSPMIASSLGMIINIVLNLVLSMSMGVKGLALATSISSFITFLIMIYFFKKKHEIIISFKNK